MARVISAKSKPKQDRGGDKAPLTPIAKPANSHGRRSIPLRDIIVDRENVQSRATMSKQAIEDYSLAMLGGDVFPAIVVFEGSDGLVLGGGFHRLAAKKLNSGEDSEVECEVRPGNKRDAFLFACRDNRTHGLRPTNRDKEHVVSKLLKDPEYSKWSDREIARLSGASNTTVGTYRKMLCPVTVKLDSEKRTYKSKTGTVSTMDVKKIGKSNPKSTSPSKPKKSKSFADDRPESKGGQSASIQSLTHVEVKSPRTPSPSHGGEAVPATDPQAANTVINGAPKLDSLAWLGATDTERQRFVSEVGLAALFNAATPQLVAGYREQLVKLLGIAP